MSTASTSSKSPTRRITLSQVAQAAGLARTTVSDILNRNAGNRYSEQTRTKVKDAVERLGYAPSRAAQVMARGRSGMVGLMLTRGFSNPFWARVAEVVQKELHKRHYRMQLVVVDGDDPKTENELVRQLHSDQVEGLIVGPVYESLDLKIHRNVFRGQLPIVAFGGEIDCEFDCIALDRDAGLKMAIQHLIDNGHQCIGYLGMPPKRPGAEARSPGTHHVEVIRRMTTSSEDLIFWHEDTGRYEDLSRLTNRFADWWKAQPENQRPTAMLCHNDQVAMTAMSVFSGKGIHVPDDLSLIGYDNIPESAYLIPPLTTIDSHMPDEMEQAIHQLLFRINEPGRPRTAKAIAPSLVQRDSVRKIHGHSG